MVKNKQIEEFIRDVCSVVPRPKSEVRRRLNRILESEKERFKKVIEGIPVNFYKGCGPGEKDEPLIEKNKILKEL